jgi:hypothetical protein
MDLARGYSLVAVGGSIFPLTEWAAGADAVNLPTNAVSPSAIPHEVRRDLDSAVFYGGRNGWTGPSEKAHARSHLVKDLQAGRLDPGQPASYAMSQWISDRGAKRLRELLDREPGRRGLSRLTAAYPAAPVAVAIASTHCRRSVRCCSQRSVMFFPTPR